MSQQNVADLFDSQAHTYDQSIVDFRYVGPQWLKEQLSLCGAAASPCVLDLGCGTGTSTQPVKEIYANASVTGVDISPNMVAIARTKQLYDHLYVHNLDQPLHFLPSNYFNLVIAVGCFEFLQSPHRCLEEIYRVLQRHGELFISFQHHIPGNPQAPRTTYSGSVHLAYTQAEVHAMLQERGFHVTVLETCTGYTSKSGFACPYIFVRCRKSG
ncbi:MAG TPA: methyltransferase domain-containing protein [Herpetosiphonaceae bacterium]|nr:methyltransferase domain-containing protein [Herpetosiphonaceae bacterium]